MMFELPQHNTECLFLLSKKATVTIHILSLQLTYKDNILYNKAVKIKINAFGFTKIILNVIVCHHCFSSLVVSNSDIFYLFETCYYCTILQC